MPLTEDVEVLKQAVDALQAQGNTNHADAVSYTHLDVYKRQGKHLTMLE